MVSSVPRIAGVAYVSQIPKVLIDYHRVQSSMSRAA